MDEDAVLVTVHLHQLDQDVHAFRHGEHSFAGAAVLAQVLYHIHRRIQQLHVRSAPVARTNQTQNNVLCVLLYDSLAAHS